MEETCELLWSIYVDGEYIKNIIFFEYLDFNKIYTIDNNDYEITSCGWTNHRLNMREV